MNTECIRIADQLRRAFEGKAWHGPSLKKILADVTAEHAAAHAIASAHSIWELVLHIEAWTQAALDASNGVAMPNMLAPDKDWPAVHDASPKGWEAAASSMFAASEALSLAIGQFGDDRLPETVPGRRYDFYYLFHGVVQHSLYHGGQIALLKKAAQPSK
jgi:DinB superfamily